MRKLILSLLVIASVALILLAGGALLRRQKPAIVIGDISISKQEFENALFRSTFSPVDKAFRKDFLNKYINRKLILREAERLGIHRKPSFLQEVQQFWEQALLNIALSKKIKELAINDKVSDVEVRKYYRNNRKVIFPDKEISEVYDQIRWTLQNEKQRSAIEQWADNLKETIVIKIDYEQLGLEAD